MATNLLVQFLAWFTSNGGFLHPHLQYRDKGIFADKGPIPSGELLVSIPINLHFNSCNPQLDDFFTCELSLAESYLKHRADPNHFFYPFFALMPEADVCVSPLCGIHDFSKISLGFASYIDIERMNIPSELLVAMSVIRSYQFQYGLLPGVSFFNHDAEKGNVLSKLSNMDDPNFDAGVGTIARVDYAQGDEVYLNYHPTNEIFHGSAQMYYLYGFMPHTAKFDTCVDMSSVRHADHDYQQKLKCIQTLALQSGTSAENLLAEISLAEQHGDGAWAEGGNLALAQILQSLREL